MNIPTKVIRKDIARDGGTILLVTEVGNFYIDKRIGTKTRNMVFDDYPSKGHEVSPEIAEAIHELNKNK